MGKKRKGELPKSQLWVVELRKEEPRRIYVYADRWFDVRESAAMIFRTGGSFSDLFISAVMVDEPTWDGAEAVYEIYYTGLGASGTLSRNVRTLVTMKEAPTS